MELIETIKQMNIAQKIPQRILTNLERGSDNLDEQLQECENKCKSINNTKGNLNEYDGYDCKICNNNGYIAVPKLRDNNYVEVFFECKCMNTRRLLRKLARSGLKDVIKKYNFDNYEAAEKWQQTIKEKAIKSITDEKWLYIGGQSGIGKTHLCTAVCGKYLKLGKEVRYMLWVSDAKQLKSVINDDEQHTKLINEYKKTDVLYIDDFFKNGKERNGEVQAPSAADVQLAYDIINYRYNNPELITIISSERTINNLMDIDEAIAGRIMERANYGEFIICLKQDSQRNYRTKNFLEI